MKITMNEENYRVEMNVSEAAGKSEVSDYTGMVMCHLLLEVLTKCADDEDEAKEMMLDVFEKMTTTLTEFFSQGVFDKLHQTHCPEKDITSSNASEEAELYQFMEYDFKNWITEADIDVADYIDRYKSFEKFNLNIYTDNTNYVFVDIVDGKNHDTIFKYPKNMLFEKEFETIAIIDLMHLVVLGDKLFGEEHNKLRNMLSNEYVDKCRSATY